MGSYNRENTEKENISRIEKYTGLKEIHFLANQTEISRVKKVIEQSSNRRKW